MLEKNQVPFMKGKTLQNPLIAPLRESCTPKLCSIRCPHGFFFSSCNFDTSSSVQAMGLWLGAPGREVPQGGGILGGLG